ncbi:hypothetical protein BH18VER1_BH18VER1_02360 [soil metagenome]
MDSGGEPSDLQPRALRRVLILADSSADWRVAGLRQLDRLALSLREFMRTSGEPITVAVLWSTDTPQESRWIPDDSRLQGLMLNEADRDEEEEFDLVLSTRVVLYLNCFPQLLMALPQPDQRELTSGRASADYGSTLERKLAATPDGTHKPWRYLQDQSDISLCAREILWHSGKTQDGLISRHINRPISRAVSRLLLKLSIAPNAWSISIFALPISACFLFLRGTDRAFFFGCAIYQLYSILDGCDGEIARAKFLQSDFGRRLDSLLDLAGNMLLALCLGAGLAHQWHRTYTTGWWFYAAEGIIAATLIGLSEGIVFARRSRVVTSPAVRWNGALYQRHHEFLERSGILVFGERFAWWLVQFTKRDMAMLVFLFLAAIGFAEAILHLLVLVSGASAVFACNAFFRQPTPAVAQEAS